MPGCTTPGRHLTENQAPAGDPTCRAWVRTGPRRPTRPGPAGPAPRAGAARARRRDDGGSARPHDQGHEDAEAALQAAGLAPGDQPGDHPGQRAGQVGGGHLAQLADGRALDAHGQARVGQQHQLACPGWAAAGQLPAHREHGEHAEFQAERDREPRRPDLALRGRRVGPAARPALQPAAGPPGRERCPDRHPGHVAAQGHRAVLRQDRVVRAGRDAQQHHGPGDHTAEHVPQVQKRGCVHPARRHGEHDHEHVPGARAPVLTHVQVPTRPGRR